MGRKQTSIICGLTIILLGARLTPAAPHGAESLGRLARLVNLAVMSPQPERDLLGTISEAAEIATNLEPGALETADLSAFDLERIIGGAWIIATGMTERGLEMRQYALETALALEALRHTRPAKLPLKKVLADPSPEMRAAVLELAPVEWILSEKNLLVGLIIGDADARVAATAGWRLCRHGGSDFTGELQSGMMLRLRSLLADPAVPLPARLGCARCVARDSDPESAKILAKFLKSLPKSYAAVFKKQLGKQP